jgi:predicted HTH domain antitoxin
MSVKIELDDEIAALLSQFNKPLDSSVQEMLVLELYRQGKISSGKAAELLGFAKIDFIKYASSLGIDYITMTDEEWQAELKVVDSL